MANTPQNPVTIAPPETKTEQSAGSVAIPEAKTSQAAGSVAIPTAKTSAAAGSVAIPESKTSVAAGSVAVPTAKSSVSAGSVAIPSTVNSVASALFPRALRPILGLNFADDLYSQCGKPSGLSDLMTYSRASSATFINRRINGCTGRYEYFLDTDYVGSVTNLVTYSEQFDNADWTKTNSSIAANQVKSHVGNRTADKLFEDATNGIHNISQSITVSSGADVTFSVYAKADEVETIGIYENTAGDGQFFNLKNGAIGGVFVASPKSSSIEYAGNGWYKCTVTVTVPATTAQFRIYTAQNDETFSYAGSTDSGVLIWGAQLTESVKPLPYVQTLATSASDTFTESVRREYDPVTGESLGALIEGASTNLALRSEEFDNVSWSKLNGSVTSNQITSPDGTISMDKLESTWVGESSIAQTLTITASATTTVSFYAKAGNVNWVSLMLLNSGATAGARQWFDLSSGSAGGDTNWGGFSSDSNSIKYIGDGIYRCSATFSTDGSTSVQVRANIGNADLTPNTAVGEFIYLWGAQVEELPFASSYIRTEGAAASRAADNGSLNQPIFPDDSFSIHMEVDANSAAINSGANRYLYYHSGAGSSVSYLLLNGVNGDLQCRHGVGVFTVESSPLDSFNVTLSYSASSLSIYYNNALVSTESTVFQNDITQPIDVGRITNVQHLFGNIKKLVIYDTAVTATEVSQL